MAEKHLRHIAHIVHIVHIVLVDHLQEINKESNNLKKQKIHNIFIKTN